ncbi:MAG: L-fucose/L-arabinose isomerase family protein [Anaerolineae bacterium]|nr:L-fucose/L-arabinose isomerase family protein [Anaerolineae bacterium]
MSNITLGLIVGNRGFFPDHLCETGRKTILEVLEQEGIDCVALTPEDTPFGSVETFQDAEKCAALFKQHADEIDGILVTLPNFGDERGVANTIRLSGVGVPVLVHAFPETPGKMTIADRRDSFCGKMSVCNNLTQYGIPFSLTKRHTVDPTSEAFRKDLQWFVGVCRVVKGLSRVRLGMVGARPAAFNTVRFSEKLLESAGISVETIDLSEVFGKAEKLADEAPEVKAKLEAIGAYTTVEGVPDPALLRMAKFGVVIDQWMEENRLVATAIQCWTSMEEFYGVVPCTIMSMMGNQLMPSACETDITGLVGMYAMQLASGTPSALVDWNNDYGEDDDKAVIFHCSNLPKHFFAQGGEMDYQAIIAGTVGVDNTYGTITGRLKAEPFTFCRVSTDDTWGSITTYLGEGRLTDDPLKTFGGYGVIEIPELQTLLKYICENGFEHHTALNLSQVADVLDEAFTKYLGWEVYHHTD